MKVLCDLVTVSREYKAMRERAVTEKTEQSDRTVLKYLGRRLCVMICESGNLPECWYRKKNSRSRGIDRTETLLNGVCFGMLSAYFWAESFFISSVLFS